MELSWTAIVVGLLAFFGQLLLYIATRNRDAKGEPKQQAETEGATAGAAESSAQAAEASANVAKIYADQLKDSCAEVTEMRLALEKHSNLISNLSADNKYLTSQVSLLECKTAELSKENQDLKAQTARQENELQGLRNDNNTLRDWVRRLSAQVVSLGGTPVPMERKETL